MPKFEVLNLEETMVKAATGRRAELDREYLGYIEELKAGRAGALKAAEGESLAAIRRRLGAAAKLARKDLVIKRVDDRLYFWTKPRASGVPGRGRGRPRKAAQG